MNKKLGLILLPLVPLSAIGVVSLVNRALPSSPPSVECKAATVHVEPVAPRPHTPTAE